MTTPEIKDAKGPEKAGRPWFCVHSQPKREHIAAARLSEDADIEVFFPRVRFRRLTRKGPVWVTEALFPNYLFARFDPAISLRKVHHASGVRGVVHFGNRWPTIPDAVIEELRAAIGPECVRQLPQELKPGDEVQLTGALHGLAAVVSRVMPGRKRVAVLMEFLGRQTMVELGSEAVVRIEPRRVLL